MISIDSEFAQDDEAVIREMTLIIEEQNSSGIKSYELRDGSTNTARFYRFYMNDGH